MTVPEIIARVAEVQQALANSLSAEHVNSKTCAQKGDYTYYGMYAKYAKENHEELHGRKWETLNEAKVIFHQCEHVFAADQKTSLLAVFLDYLMHHCDAQACEKNTTRVLQTIAELGSSDGNFADVIPEHTWGSHVLPVCPFDRTGGGCACEPFKR